MPSWIVAVIQPGYASDWTGRPEECCGSDRRALRLGHLVFSEDGADVCGCDLKAKAETLKPEMLK
jgi:hypothetical protein